MIYGLKVDSNDMEIVIESALIFACANAEVYVHVLANGQRRLGDLVIEQFQHHLVGECDVWIVFHDHKCLSAPLGALLTRPLLQGEHLRDSAR